MGDSALLNPPRPGSRVPVRRSELRALLEQQGAAAPAPAPREAPAAPPRPAQVDVVVPAASAVVPAASTEPGRAIDLLIVAGVAVSIVGGLVGAGAGAGAVVEAAAAASVPLALVVAVSCWGLLAAACLYVQTRLWWRYRPVAHDVPGREAPTMTVIIPAYNEGAMVARTIESVASATYPRERLEVFVIDDGSTDDTWEHIQRAAARFPGLVTPIRQPKNRGKRAALEVGFRRAWGEVLVTIDSDSVIEPQTLHSLAAPFRDRRVGAVAGRVAVYNRDGGLIPRMLNVVFALSFDFHRAAQSEYGTVYCCPGALTAYRASVVREVLDEWLHQRFLGVTCTTGEDRALTNWVLKSGHDSVYQRTAVVHTIVPERYAQLCKMFLRWDRSYVREELRFAGIVWRRSPRALGLALFESVVRDLGLGLRYVSLVMLGLLVTVDPRILITVAAMTVAGALLRGLFFLRVERSLHMLYGVAYAFFFLCGLWWIFPYAVLTVRSRGWLTR